ncbi:MAG TPA: YbjQ family protein [Planctomycetota bacterium]|nr:YbjQ family protein [Planctomycetota bacterium]
MILTNLEAVTGKTVKEHLGLVQGSTIRAKHVGRDIMAGLKNIVGGEVKSYTQLLQQARDEATQRMVQQAEQLGANAVVNIRYSTASVMQGAAEILAYGTAVILED